MTHIISYVQSVSSTKSIKCGIFKFDSKKWTNSKSLEIDLPSMSSLDFGICQNNKYDPKIVYAASNKGHFVEYDLHKQEWNVIFEDQDNNLGNKRPYVWMQDHSYIIYSTDFAENFKYLDIRNSEKKWMENDELYESFELINSKNEYQDAEYFISF